MSIQYAMEVLTAPSLTQRQALVKFLAQRAKRRAGNCITPRIEDVWYVIAICMKWGAITHADMPNFSRLALGKLAQDVFDCWGLLVQEGI